VYIDLHGRDLPEVLVPWAIYKVTCDEKLDKHAETLARLYGTKFIERTTPPAIEIRKKIPTIRGEAGSLGTYEEADIFLHMQGVTNVMKYLGMLEGKPRLPGRQLVFNTAMPEQTLDSADRTGFQMVNTNRGGLLYPKVKAGDLVQKDQILGEVGDLK